ncbi:paeninodin family lasso peptide [Paenibacillus cremeus]|uniref:Paeninodin family lasso peptide n=1 Tax=Paenibacillus cremeus TaxID=2163881 RepID=A0A559K0E5_9BACL|nr:paeninodin family lasso peptide [Paenibacillus cremeus]TVY05625.1 paeninodin family lasso peptide [Paenibacillus cremeus]
MKREWQKPELEVLEVNMTMGQSDGDFTDKEFPVNTPKKDLTFS